MRILLDENMPEDLLTPLRVLGHTADSIASLQDHTPSTAGSRLRRDFHGSVHRYRLVAHRQGEPMADGGGVTEARAIILTVFKGG